MINIFMQLAESSRELTRLSFTLEVVHGFNFYFHIFYMFHIFFIREDLGSIH